METFSDTDAAKALNLELRNFKDLKKRLHKIRPITHRGKYGLNVNEDDLKVLKDAITLKKAGVIAWDDAINRAIEASRPTITATDTAAAHLLDLLMNGDGSPDELAAAILQEKYDRYEAFVDEVTRFSDFLRHSGSLSLSAALNAQIDLIAKAAAFDLLHADGLLPKPEL